jgi:hypothetical protein
VLTFLDSVIIIVVLLFRHVKADRSWFATQFLRGAGILHYTGGKIERWEALTVSRKRK